MITAAQYVEQARSGDYLGIPYKEMDCQGLLERVLADCGTVVDWRGTNDMWRNALSMKGPIADIASIPAGAWLFTLKHDGGEVQRGYHDNEGNAAHAGIYLGGSDVMHSTTGGCQMDVITSKRWTHYGLCKLIDFSGESSEVRDLVRKLGQYRLYEIYAAIVQEWG